MASDLQLAAQPAFEGLMPVGPTIAPLPEVVMLALERGRVRHRGRRLDGASLRVDIDRFKTYNDRYGHLKGDECLEAVAAAIDRASQRASDLTARFGGDEFCVLLPDTPRRAARCCGEHPRRGGGTLRPSNSGRAGRCGRLAR